MSKMHIIQVIFLVKIIVSAEDFSKETKYIDLLPEKEKEAFLEKIARRLFNSVQVNDSKDGISGEKVPQSQLDVNDDFIHKILLEETMNMRRNEPNDTQNINSDIKDAQVYFDNQSSDKKDDIVDLTFRAGKRGKRNSPEKLRDIEDSKIVRVTVDQNDTSNNTIKTPKVYESDREDIQIKFLRQNYSENSVHESEVTTHSELQGTQMIDFDTEDVGRNSKKAEVVPDKIEKEFSNEKKTSEKSQENQNSQLSETNESVGIRSDKSEQGSVNDEINAAKLQENKHSKTKISLVTTLPDNRKQKSLNEKKTTAKSQESKYSETDKILDITMSGESDSDILIEKINAAKSQENKDKISKTNKSLGITLSDKNEQGSFSDRKNAAKSQENEDSEPNKNLVTILPDKSKQESLNEKGTTAKSRENNDNEPDKIFDTMSDINRQGSLNEKMIPAKLQGNKDSKTNNSLGIILSDENEHGSLIERKNVAKPLESKDEETDKNLVTILPDKSKQESSNEKETTAKSQANKDIETDKILDITMSDENRPGSVNDKTNPAKSQRNKESETEKYLVTVQPIQSEKSSNNKKKYENLGISQKISISIDNKHDSDNKESERKYTSIDVNTITSTKYPFDITTEQLLKVNETKKDLNNSSKINFQRSHTVHVNSYDANNLGHNKLIHEFLVERSTSINEATNATHETISKKFEIPNATKTSTSEHGVGSNGSTPFTTNNVKLDKSKEASNITEVKIKIDNDTKDISNNISHSKEEEYKNITKEVTVDSHDKYEMTASRNNVPEKSITGLKNIDVKPTNLMSLLEVAQIVFKENIDKQQRSVDIETTTLKTEVLTQGSAGTEKTYDKELADAKFIVLERFLKQDNGKNNEKLNQHQSTEKEIHDKSNNKISYSLANDMIKVLRNQVSEKSSQEYIQPKEYNVYEVPAKPVRQNPRLENRDNPYYVPVYNYSPENAYYDPRNRFGPNTDNNEEELSVKVGRDIEYSENRERFSVKNKDNMNNIFKNHNNNEHQEVLRFFRQYNSHRNENQRKFRFGTFQKKKQKASQFKINMPVVIQYPKFTDIILSPNDYLDMDYYYGKMLRRHKSKETFENMSEQKDISKEKYISTEKEISMDKEVSDEKAVSSENLESKEKDVSNLEAKSEENDYFNEPEKVFEIASDIDVENKIKSLKNHIRLIRQQFYENQLFGYIPPWNKTKSEMFTESTNSVKNTPGYLRITSNNDSKHVKQTSENNIALDYFYGRTSDYPEFETKYTDFVYKNQKTKPNKVNRKPDKDKHARNDKYLYQFNKKTMQIPPKHAQRPPNVESITRENKNLTDLEAIKQVLSIIPENDLLNALRQLLNIYPLKQDKHSNVETETNLNLEPYLLVLEDMVENVGEGLKQYDWLGTTVNVQAALSKLMDLTHTLKNNLNLPDPDLQLLKYAIYLHKTARSMRKVFQRTKLPRNKNKKKGIIKTSGLLNRTWLYRKLIEITQHDKVITDEDLDEFTEFLNNLQFFLYDLHTAVQQIANITKYKNQNWFQNIKDLYLDTNKKKLLEALLHISSARLLDLIEESAKNGLEDDFLLFVETHEKQVKTAVDEFNFVLKIMKEMSSDR